MGGGCGVQVYIRADTLLSLLPNATVLASGLHPPHPCRQVAAPIRKDSGLRERTCDVAVGHAVTGICAEGPDDGPSVRLFRSSRLFEASDFFAVRMTKEFIVSRASHCFDLGRIAAVEGLGAHGIGDTQ
jgi:hypothetical protein